MGNLVCSIYVFFLHQGTEAVDVTRAKLTRQLAERTTHKMQV
jgi:hypothetical protein